ncbi:hypothetical protein ACFL5Z_17930 [Planctomycetota bacterium]
MNPKRNDQNALIEGHGFEPSSLRSARIVCSNLVLLFTDQLSVDTTKRIDKRSWDKTIIVLATVAETVCTIQNNKLSKSDIEAIIGKAAVNWGASGDLLAAVIRYLPQLYIATRSANLEPSETCISLPVKLQYEIWTEGQHRIVKNIGKYKKNKNKYLFWADITNRQYESLGQKRCPLSTPALRLLLYLAENMGISIPRTMVFEHVIETTSDGVVGWKTRLAHYFTELRKFAGEDFKEIYLPPPDRFTDTVTLNKSFKNKYFVFVTRRSSE